MTALRLLRRVFALAAGSICGLAMDPAVAQLGAARPGPSGSEAKLRVTGSATISADARTTDHAVEVRGQLRDDAGQPIPDRHLRIAFTGARRLPPGQSCGASGTVHVTRGAQGEPDEYVVGTAPDGTFCLLARTPVREGSVLLRFEADKLYSSASLEVPIDSSRSALLLGFSDPPQILALEQAQHTLFVDTEIDPEPAEEVRGELSLIVSLSERHNGPRRELTRLDVRPGERGQLTLEASQIGAPGPADLLLTYPGDRTLRPASARTTVTRTARVNLKTAHRLSADHLGEASVTVAATSVAGPVPNGTIEARVGGVTVGIASVRDGTAELELRLRGAGQASGAIELRYLPAAPWWRPSRPLLVEFTIAPTPWWYRLPWVFAAIAVALWLLGALRRPSGSAPRTPGAENTLPPGEARVDVLRRAPHRDAGWQGVVRDAHDGMAISGARLRVARPSFDAGLDDAVVTEADGRFVLPTVSRAEGTQLIVSARWHTTIERPLPPPGEMVVHLVARRRTLLERLTRWASRRGAPFHKAPEATPGSVARAAGERGLDDVKDWADAVEQAAYGPDPTDAEREASIANREPS